MKKILLTIMILFSLNVNSNDKCILPDIKFFEVTKEDGIEKFNFKPFYDSISPSFTSLPTDEVEVLGVKFSKDASTAALLKVYNFFNEKLAAKSEITAIPLKNLIVGGSEQQDKFGFENLVDEMRLRALYDASVKREGHEAIDDKLKDINAKIMDKISKLISYFLQAKETKRGFWSWVSSIFTTGETVKHFAILDPALLNSSLNFIYLYALSFLVKSEEDTSKFFGCMYNIYENQFIDKFDAAIAKGIDIGAIEIFRTITSEASGKVKLAPLTLEESRGTLNLLSSTLNSLANLKFTEL